MQKEQLSALSAKYRHKIKTIEQLRELLGGPPREQRVIMCHGVFDVVHPGHLRHLIYAKNHADILVASLTADRHITKGVHRPHVPQELRALNLACFEFVDYVVIDPNDKPIDSLKQLQPDFFAKGYEYVATGLPPKTQEEVDTVRAYGGEVIFTPGDYVLSSSRLIEMQPPQLKAEKLLTVMDDAGLSFDDLRHAVHQMAGRRIHVVGDTIVDSYTQCAMIGGQTKTPTMSVLFQGREDYIGGAGIVAAHLRAAGAHVTFSTVLGDDELKDFVLEGLEKFGVDAMPIVDKTRPTTQKNAIVAGGYRLLKVDTLDNRSISDEIVDTLAERIRDVPYDAVVFSDFRHGIFNRRTIPPLCDAIPGGRFKVADSQVASRWGNITEFKGFDLITPNEREARFALADQDSGVRPLARILYEAAECRSLILKLGDKGVLTCKRPDDDPLDNFFVLDSFVDNLVDAVGAGDALLAYATLAMLATGSIEVATIIGSIAAALECEVDGNHPITPEAVLGRIDVVDKNTSYQG